jgi:DNA mismatch repair ATPase MutS
MGPTWWKQLQDFFRKAPPSFGFDIHPRDDAGTRALSELEGSGLRLIAEGTGQSADHVRSFFAMLRAELAFYVGCINLHERLERKGVAVCFPSPAPRAEHRFHYRGLIDLGLSLTSKDAVIGNEGNADGKPLIVLTGANTGGKSTLLRGFGLAQLMMQCGMFVPAEEFVSSLCDGLYTHFKREEDTTMESGKLDEELRRMKAIVDHIHSNAMLLLNESFSATNEREGSEIARQVITGLLDGGVRVHCVTHLYELAHGLFEARGKQGLFLRAGRREDGSRTFKLTEGEPLPTSFGEDIYRRIFGETGGART